MWPVWSRRVSGPDWRAECSGLDRSVWGRTSPGWCGPGVGCSRRVTGPDSAHAPLVTCTGWSTRHRGSRTSSPAVARCRRAPKAHGLPRGRRQKSRAGLSHVSDVGYDEWALLLELDGRDGHIEEGAFRDRRRDDAFAVRALLTLRYGWYDVTDNPCAVAWQVATVLRPRGWPGDLRRCGRCRALARGRLPGHGLRQAAHFRGEYATELRRLFSCRAGKPTHNGACPRCPRWSRCGSSSPTSWSGGRSPGSTWSRSAR